MEKGKNNTDIPYLNETIRFISKEINPEKIILFGSRARGNYRNDSDFDLFIVKNIPKEKVRATRLLIRKLLLKLQLKNNISFDIHVDSQDRIDYRTQIIQDQFYQDIFKNGEVIYAK